MKIISPTFRHSSLMLLALTAACATTAQHRSGISQLERGAVAEPMRSGAPSDVLTGKDLATAGASTTAEAVRRLRPEFLRPSVVPSSTTAVLPSIYVNGVYAGTPELLSAITIDEVEDVRFFKPSEARLWWGPSCPCAGGVVHVRTKRGG